MPKSPELAGLQVPKIFWRIVYLLKNLLHLTELRTNHIFMNLYIGNIPYSISESELTQLFAAFGEVTSINIVKDKMTNRSKGFGFVDMPDSAAANAAINELNGKEINGRKMIVNEARPKTDKTKVQKRYE